MALQDQTFMTIHNLTPDANILFASESVFDILGYQPSEVLNKAAFDFFHPAEVNFARSVHSRGVRLDKAAVLHYARIRSRDGRWVNCECCFTVVHDVLVASTSIYNMGAKSKGRAMDAPTIRRLFSSSPRDPRYHMLEHLSPKFRMPPTEREPRAALVLNRFTRNLSIMFATTAVTTILGLRPDELLGRPFYHCIQENCLTRAIDCLESAKKNESIAYLRFWFRDPRQDDLVRRAPEPEDDDDDTDMATEDDEDGDDDDHGGVDAVDRNANAGLGGATGSPSAKGWTAGQDMEVDGQTPDRCRARSEPERRRSPTYRTYPTPPSSDGFITPRSGPGRDTFELEAVVSCTSDGLVVILRKARPPIPDPQLPLIPAFNHENGLFAAPWSLQPIEPHYPPELVHQFRPPYVLNRMPLLDGVKAPPRDQLMRSIRDDAVFAWPLVGINEGYADYGHGQPGKGSQPVDGLPRQPVGVGYGGPENHAVNPRSQNDVEAPRPPFVHRTSYDFDRTASWAGGSERVPFSMESSYRDGPGSSAAFSRPGPVHASYQHGLRNSLDVQGPASSHPMAGTPDGHHHSTRADRLQTGTRQGREVEFARPSPEVPTLFQEPHRAPRDPRR